MRGPGLRHAHEILGHTLERMRKHGGAPEQCEDTADLLRLIYYACRHY